MKKGFVLIATVLVMIIGSSCTTLVIKDGVTEIPDAKLGKGWYTGKYTRKNLTSVTIPGSVTSIGNGAFQSNKLTSLTISDGVKYIGKSAFEWNFLTSVTIPGSVKRIGEAAFRSNGLTSLAIPASVTFIGKNAFSGNKLTSVTISDGVTYIGESAFSSNKLTSVIIPASVTYIGGSAFQSNKLTSLTISDGVTEIGGGAFSYNELTSVTIPGSVTRIGNGAFQSNKLTSVTIPSSVTYIGYNAFAFNELTSVTISDGVTEIGNEAFKYNKLTSVTIPSSVTKIGKDAFSGNPLTSVTVTINKSVSFTNDSFGGIKNFERYYAGNNRQIGTYSIQGNDCYFNGVLINDTVLAYEKGIREKQERAAQEKKEQREKEIRENSFLEDGIYSTYDPHRVEQRVKQSASFYENRLDLERMLSDNFERGTIIISIDGNSASKYLVFNTKYGGARYRLSPGTHVLLVSYIDKIYSYTVEDIHRSPEIRRTVKTHVKDNSILYNTVALNFEAGKSYVLTTTRELKREGKFEFILSETRYRASADE